MEEFKPQKDLDATNDKYLYFIMLFRPSGGNISNDESIALKVLKMSLKYYLNILKQFNAKIYYDDGWFKSREDCQKACDHLNEVYLPMSKLIK
jgi:hypothetical protein